MNNWLTISTKLLSILPLLCAVGGVSVACADTESPRHSLTWNDLIPQGLSFESIDYVVGVALTSQPRYPGASQQRLEPRLLGRIEWGSVSLSGSRTGALARPGRSDAPATGLSAKLLQSDRIETSVGLRLDSGRDDSLNPDWVNLPAIPRHLRYLLTARYAHDTAVSTQLSFSGSFRPQRYGHTAAITWSLNPGSHEAMSWRTSFSLSWADRPYMQSRFGTSAGQTLPAFSPGAGLRDGSVQIYMNYRLSTHWTAIGSMTLTRYLGVAARSPIIESRSQFSTQVGLTYQNRAEFR